MAHTTASRKQKGRKLQQYIRDKILALYPELTDRDVKSVSMGQPGEDIMLSERAARLFPYSIEAKNQESIAIWKALEQCSSGNRYLTPILVFKRNRSKVYCAIEFDDFLKLIGGENDEK